MIAAVASCLIAPTAAYIAPTAPARGAVLRATTLQAPLRPHRVAQPQQQLALVRSRPIVAKAAIAQPTLVQRALMILASVAALMVGASAGAALEAMAAGTCGRAAGVLARLAYDAPELGDEDDG